MAVAQAIKSKSKNVVHRYVAKLQSKLCTFDVPSFKHHCTISFYNKYTWKQIADVKTRYQTMYTRWLAQHEEVCRFEEEHSINTRWTPSSPEYNNALVVVSQCTYRKALDTLERLFVQRLLELTKLGMNGVGMKLYIFFCVEVDALAGYKLHDKIGKALKTRAEAIRRALDAYNSAAAQLNPPRESLTWARLMDATTLADFDLLQDSRQDICQQPWTQPSHREAMNLYFSIKCVNEEILQLNVEICCLVTFMIDDHHNFHCAISANIITDPALAHVLSCQWEYRHQIHSRVALHLHQTSRLNGFTGTLLPGTREGQDQAFMAKGGLPNWATDIFGLVITHDEVIEVDWMENEVEVMEDDDGLPKEAGDLVIQLLKNISVQD